MKANERKIADDGKEVFLFPLEYMYISQGEDVQDQSHEGTLCMDFLGYGAGGRVYECPYYAPCTVRLVRNDLDTYSNMIIWESVDEVHLADGTLSKVCFQVAHDSKSPYNTVGTVVRQGDLLGYTGKKGFATGDHVHFNVARGVYSGGEYVPPNNNWQLKNSMHIYNACFVDDTVLSRPLNYRWIVYGETPPEPTDKKKRKKFPWAIYSRRLRLTKNR